MGKGNRTRQEAKASSSAGGTKLWVKIVCWAVGIAFLVVLAFSLLHTTGVLQRAVTTQKVGDMKVSALDYNIFYMYTRDSWLNATDSYFGMPNYYILQNYYGLPVDSSLDSQPNEDGTGTWRDSFNDMTVENVHSILALYQDGQAAGHVAQGSFATSGQDTLDQFQTQAETYKVSLKGYLNMYYSNNTGENDVRRVFDIIGYANSYGQYLQDGYAVGDSEVEAYYQEHRTSYDRADYYSYSFPYTTYTYTAPAEGAEPTEAVEGEPQSEEEATAMTEASKADAKAEADAFMARLRAGEDFDALALELFEAEEATHDHGEEESDHAFTSALTKNAGISGTSAVVEWVKDDARAAGDQEVVDSGSAYVVAEFVDRYRNPTRTATVRHILFSISTQLGENPTESEQAVYDTEREMVLGTAQTIYLEWQNGAATEDSFAELAKAHSADGNAQEGGIYEHFSEGAMVETFNDWVFGEDRQYGDHGIVETDYGFHLMYFVGYDNDSYYYAIQNTIINDSFSAELEEIMGKYTMTSNKMGMNLSF